VGETVAELRDAIVRRGGRSLLGPLTLTVERGDFWGVVGPNGAGKSTLLRTLAGLQPLSEGRSTVPPRKSVGFLLQHHACLPDLPFTTEDVALFGRTGLAPLGRPFRPADREAARRALSLLGLEGMRDRLYRDLSGGEQKKAQLARLLSQEAEILLLDEPTAGLDLSAQEQLTGLIGDLHRQTGRTFVMVTHEIDRLPAGCGRVLLLREGRALAQGSPADIFLSETLSRLYDSPMEVVSRGGRFHAFVRSGEAAP
jgi:ABC-type Mn2+/Zn2+ transport system ATPase subunit